MAKTFQSSAAYEHRSVVRSTLLEEPDLVTCESLPCDELLQWTENGKGAPGLKGGCSEISQLNVSNNSTVFMGRGRLKNGGNLSIFIPA